MRGSAQLLQNPDSLIAQDGQNLNRNSDERIPVSFHTDNCPLTTDFVIPTEAEWQHRHKCSHGRPYGSSPESAITGPSYPVMRLPHPRRFFLFGKLAG
jgi:hypothetical protein